MEHMSFGSRMWLALVLPFKVLFDGAFAASLAGLQASRSLPAPSAIPSAKAPTPAAEKEGPAPGPSTAEPAVVTPEVDTTAALQILSLLQREGRFIDFIQEDMTGFGDSEIGAAARIVQDGCKRALVECVQIRAIRGEAEGTAVHLEAGFDARAVRLTGSVSGQPPYSGVLSHHGWRVEHIVLPRLSQGHDPHILAPAEVEVKA